MHSALIARARWGVLAALAAACGGYAGSAPDASASPPGDADADSIVAPIASGVVDGGDSMDVAAWAPIPGACTGPWRLSEAGLFADVGRAIPASSAIAYRPSYALWSDREDKDRWVQLPAGGVIDSRDMNHWLFPVGTRFWKQFRRGDGRLEVRVVARTGPGDSDYCLGAFLWREDGSDADFVVDGAVDVHGTDHDVPAAARCLDCHGGEPGRVLGFSAVQLSHAGEPNLASLARDGLLSDAPPPGADFSPPGDDVVKAALGYLHANCGHCHAHGSITYRDTDQVLRLAVEERVPEETEVYRSVVGHRVDRLINRGYDLRVSPGHPDDSALYHWMSVRGDKIGMPPLATKHADPDGLAHVRAWIEAL